MPITPDDLATVHSFKDLAELFGRQDKLDWPISEWPTLEEADKLYGIEPEEIPGVQSLEAVRKIEGLEWGIFLVDFGPNEMRRQALRGILNRVAERAKETHDERKWPHEDILFIVRHRGTAFTLGHFKGDKLANAKLRTFGWVNPQHSRTVCNVNLPALGWGHRENWPKAWSISEITDRFFQDFNAIFQEFAPKCWIEHADKDAKKWPFTNLEDQTLFMQRITNRLLFIAFLQKKRWLKFDGEPREDYLFELYDRWKKEEVGLFYNKLYRLFFNGLNEPVDAKRLLLKDEFGTMPFLNGGLFHRDKFERETGPEGLALAPNELFNRLLGEEGLFRSYNFTAVENFDETDQEIAIDPEMLGRIFEELVTDRHDGGSYYTPRPIVSFMCREGLKGYLETEDFDAAAAEKLVDDQDPSGFHHTQFNPVIQALGRVKVLDPACGSGAYIVGMLHELMSLIGILEHRFDPLKARDEYDRKLAIIQTCLYGVDLKDFATNIARLRLWLSLLVDFKGTGDPPPLPNLSFKIASGDSLLGAAPNTLGQHHAHEDTLREIDELTGVFMTQFPPESDITQIKIMLLIDQVKQFDPPSPAENAFSWRAEFGGVFSGERAKRPGFDIVVTNPPFVRQELIKEMKPGLRQVYAAFFDGTADLYTYFYARGIQLLRSGGTLVFISSNKWLRAAYGENLRSLLSERASILSITDFGELPVFKAGTFPMIIVARKEKPHVQHPVFTQVKSLGAPYPEIRKLVSSIGLELSAESIQGAKWTLAEADKLAQLRTMEAHGTPLGQFINGAIYRGIVTGLNEAFFLDDEGRDSLIREDPRSSELIQPLAIGDDVRKWCIRQKHRWIIVTKIGVDIKRYPAIFRHLSKWRLQLQKRQDQGEHWWELRACAYYSEFEKTKIVFPEICKEPRFAIDVSGMYTNNKAFIIPTSDMFLAGVLNSRAFWEAAKLVCSALGDENNAGRLMLQWVNVRRLPIPKASEPDRLAISAIVERIVAARKADPEADVKAEEAETNARVNFLYFHSDEAPTYDEWVKKREAEKGTQIEEVRKLIAGGESGTVEFKQSLEYVDPTTLAHIPENQRNQKLAEAQKAVVHSALKTVCGFMNKNGGTLLIGVHDTDGPIGIEPDYTLLGRNKDRDGFENKLTDLLKTRFRPIPTDLEIRFVEIDGKTICRIDAPAERIPHYLDNKLYVRFGNSTEELSGRDQQDFLEKRSQDKP